MSDREVFQFLVYRWDVTAAQQIAAGLPVYRFDPQPWFGWLGAIGLDEDHVSTVDLERPLIMMRLRGVGGAAMLTDGWHRLARAIRPSMVSCSV